MQSYDHKKIEKKWQKYWEKNELFKAEENSSKPKLYTLIEFPYPSGAGLHVGHPRPYTAMDVISRKKRMEGYNVLYPIGWDAFGLPTENYAIKTGQPPQKVTKENIAIFKRQIKSLGISFDWSREVNTTDPKYYKWTQWIFLQLFKHGLAYKANIPINWCLTCKIGLANEEIVAGVCERCGSQVEKRIKKQWMLAITKYADKLLEGLKEVDYIPQAKTQQENWIGRSEGINIEYQLEGTDKKITVFTTRPDTNFGATFIALAPDGKFIVEDLKMMPNKKEVEHYIEEVKNKSDIERVALGRKKTGVFTGLYAINNLNKYKMPVYVSDFVLGNVGTGALVGVPGHDIRDFEFAQEMGLKVIRVVVGSDGDTTDIIKPEQVQEDTGTMINSDFLNGLDIHAATKKIMDYLEEKNWGKRVVNYKLRDWVFSRQRYWGEPIPLVYCEACAKKNQGKSEGERNNAGWIPLPESELPLKLPAVKKYEPTDTGESPLSTMARWVNTKCPECGGVAKRETDIMPNWAGSSWYFLRYIDPHNDNEFASMEKLKKWMPVDWYNGGMEHTVLHLLYSRFWNEFLYDIGVVPAREPYKKRTSHGMILAKGGEKMSKSKGNVVNPDDIVNQYGADTLRTYIMFMGPFDQAVEWDPQSLVGIRRFIERVWTLRERVSNTAPYTKELERVVHQSIKKVSEGIEAMNLNTPIAQLMTLLNALGKFEQVPQQAYETLLILFSLYAPHLCEELWETLGHKESITKITWPKFNPSFLQTEEFELVIQINGKIRDKYVVSSDITEEELRKDVISRVKVKQYIQDSAIKQFRYIKGKLVSIVT